MRSKNLMTVVVLSCLLGGLLGALAYKVAGDIETYNDNYLLLEQHRDDNGVTRTYYNFQGAAHYVLEHGAAPPQESQQVGYSAAQFAQFQDKRSVTRHVWRTCLVPGGPPIYSITVNKGMPPPALRAELSYLPEVFWHHSTYNQSESLVYSGIGDAPGTTTLQRFADWTEWVHSDIRASTADVPPVDAVTCAVREDRIAALPPSVDALKNLSLEKAGVGLKGLRWTRKPVAAQNPHAIELMAFAGNKEEETRLRVRLAQLRAELRQEVIPSATYADSHVFQDGTESLEHLIEVYQYKNNSLVKLVLARPAKDKLILSLIVLPSPHGTPNPHGTPLP